MVFGTIPKSNNNNKGPVARYILDNTPVLTTTLPVSSSQVRNQAFFSAQDLSDTSLHTLKIEVMQVDNRTPYILQHFFVRPHDFSAPGGQDDSVNGDPDGNGVDPTGGAVTTTSFESPSMTPGARYLPGSEDTSTTSADPMQIVKILSGVLGGVIALIIIVLVLFYVRRRLKSTRESGRMWSKFWRYSPGPHDRPRPETMFTSFTTPESIARNDPASLVRGSSAYTKSDGRSDLLFAGSMFGPSPLPPPEPWITPPLKGSRF